jgi:hypothetical protein
VEQVDDVNVGEPQDPLDRNVALLLGQGAFVFQFASTKHGDVPRVAVAAEKGSLLLRRGFDWRDEGQGSVVEHLLVGGSLVVPDHCRSLAEEVWLRSRLIGQCLSGES